MDVKISLPLLPLRDIVVFPSMVIPLFVGRDKSISALNEVMKKDKKIILVTQKNSEIDDPKKTDVFMYGCEGSILQLLKLPDGTVKVLVEGIKRVKILDFKDNEKFITCDYTHYNDVSPKDEDLFPLAATALRRLEKLTSINKKISNETINSIKQLKDPSQIADNIASHITATISEKQQIFETIDVKKRLNAIIKIMENETSIIGVEKRIRGRVKAMNGEFSGGTIASLGATMASIKAKPELINVLANPFSLTEGFQGPDQPDDSKPLLDEKLGMWVTPFVMAPINTKNIHRSNKLMNHIYGKDFLYNEMWITGPGEEGKAAAEMLAGNNPIAGDDVPAPGEGPSREKRENGNYDILFCADVDGKVFKASVSGDMDPGYGSTSKMITESAICLVKDAKELEGGIYTPAAALGNKLISRLEANAGLTFIIE